MKKSIIVFACVVLVGIAVFMIFFRGSSNEYEFRFEKVSRGDITMNVTATGTINPVISVEVGTQVSGIISKLYADFNSVVKEGQVIAQIDPTFLQQSVKDASANLERAKAQNADAKRVLDRTKALYDKNLESQVNYDAALTQYESNQASLKQAEASLDRAKINLAYATIYAPINGVVIDRKVNVGQTVAASFSSPTLYTIANDLRKMQVETTVDETDIGRISIGQEATFTVDAYPDEEFKGTVSQIRLAPVSIQNVVNYTVIINVNNDKLKLMPGMTANVKVLVGSSSNVLRVPNLALRFQPPADLVDSATVRQMREAGFGMRGGRLKEGSAGGETQKDSSGGSRASGGRRGTMNAIRDSILAAHGGKMSDEELMGQMRSAFEKMRQAAEQAKAPAPKPATTVPVGTRFGIEVKFPEYQKSAYVPVHQTGRGRIWILESSGKLKPVFVSMGLTDGRYTEVTNSAISEGEEIVLGASLNSDSQGSNPLTPSGSRSMRGGPR
jgi:HlyD family secretion protein